MNKCVRCSIALDNSNWYLSFQKKNLRKCKPCAKPPNLLEKRKQSYAKYKNLIFNKLGNKCACEKCNIDDLEILSIDHIYGGGAQEKKIKKGIGYLKYLNKLSIEKLINNYQLLCYNCNYSKGFFKICGHMFEVQ